MKFCIYLQNIIKTHKLYLPMEEQNIKNKTIVEKLSEDKDRKYYVYRLVDPRSLLTFYVGKGCDYRVFQHMTNVKKLVSKDEDLTSLKSQQIASIIADGMEVIPVIHRWGLTDAEAYELEAALIDAYPGLTNIQSGHDAERGVITLSELNNVFVREVYEEPEEDYVLIKTTYGAISDAGNLYEATRSAWRANLENAKKYNYVLSVVYGIVRQVYKVKDWYQVEDNRIAFIGEKATGTITNLIGKLIPEKYRQKGASNPFLYKKM